MATRNNPLISWANMSFDTFNLLHRWFGRIVALEAITHTVAFGVQVGAFSVFSASVSKALYLQFGLVVSYPLLIMKIFPLSRSRVLLVSP